MKVLECPKRWLGISHSVHVCGICGAWWCITTGMLGAAEKYLVVPIATSTSFPRTGADEMRICLGMRWFSHSHEAVSC